MSLQIRRGLEVDRGAITFDEGEIFYVTDTQLVYIGDGVTAGGILVSNIGGVSSFNIATGAGTVDAITATFSPPLTLADKMLCAVVATGANTSTTPTFAPDGLTAHTITKYGGSALLAGDIPAALAVILLEYNLANTRWELLNPATPKVNPYYEQDTAADPSPPAANKGRFWSSVTNGIENPNFVGSNGIKRRLSRDLISTVRNTSGGNLVAGDVVYTTGATGTAPNVAKAKADSLTTMQAVGIVMETIANNAYGLIQRFGRNEFAFDTSAFSVNDVLYLSASTAGALTNVRPAHPNFNQQIGVVVVSGVGNGSIFITVNDPQGYELGTNQNAFSVGDGAAGIKEIDFVNANTGKLQWNPSAARTLTLPDVTSTLETQNNKDATGGYAGLTLFKINFKNAANTFTSFFTNTNTASRTYTFPDQDGTIALTGNDYFTIPLESGTLSPADSTTYYFGLLRLAPGTTATNFDFNIGFDCTIVGAIVSTGNNLVQGTGEDNTLYIRNVTQATSSSVGAFKTNAAAGDVISTTFTGLSISVASGDFICAQFDSPAYAINPTNVLYFLTLILKK